MTMFFSLSGLLALVVSNDAVQLTPVLTPEKWNPFADHSSKKTPVSAHGVESVSVVAHEVCDAYCTSAQSKDHSWDKKCFWSSCKGCGACKGCDNSCAQVQAHSWEDKCGWSNCKGCDECAEFKARNLEEKTSIKGKPCEASCALAKAQSWENKCGWSDCQGCQECAFCDDFCTSPTAEKHSWEDRCAWSTCKGCSTCEEIKLKGSLKEQLCDTTCALSIAHSWTEKCSWSTCQGCKQCSFCDDFCTSVEARSHGWNLKCGWETCKGCTKCAEIKLKGSLKEEQCDATCALAKAQSWKDKCGWQNCQGCKECSFCDDTCKMSTAHSWEDKCGWSNCKGCAACSFCEDHCTSTEHNESHTWEDKCSWSSCKACGACEETQVYKERILAQQGCVDFCTSPQSNSSSWDEKCGWSTCKSCSACIPPKTIFDDAPSEPMGDPSFPRMLVSGGCDGSNAVLHHAHFLLALHGFKTPVQDNRQMLQQRGSVQLNNYYQEKNKTLVIKATIGQDRETMLSHAIADMGTLVVLNTRRNKIDQVVCMIKDCFNETMGHPVMHGVKSDMCKKRRKLKNSSIEYKAFVNASMLVENIKQLEADKEDALSELEKLGYNVETLEAEALLDFEWNADAVWTALPAWKKFLSSWGIQLNNQKIIQYLQENVGTRDPPRYHTDTIFDFGLVQEALKDQERYKWMLREDTTVKVPDAANSEAGDRSDNAVMNNLKETSEAGDSAVMDKVKETKKHNQGAAKKQDKQEKNEPEENHPKRGIFSWLR